MQLNTSKPPSVVRHELDFQGSVTIRNHLGEEIGEFTFSNTVAVDVSHTGRNDIVLDVVTELAQNLRRQTKTFLETRADMIKNNSPAL